jgi:CobQ/CobB/MinD/ParA nucleotide binding domain
MVVIGGGVQTLYFRYFFVAWKYDAASEPISFTVTSADRSEGKTFVASNLALAFAAAGYRTLLVDGDASRGQRSSTFGVPAVPGVPDGLRSTAVSETALRCCDRRAPASQRRHARERAWTTQWRHPDGTPRARKTRRDSARETFRPAAEPGNGPLGAVINCIDSAGVRVAGARGHVTLEPRSPEDDG